MWYGIMFEENVLNGFSQQVVKPARYPCRIRRSSALADSPSRRAALTLATRENVPIVDVIDLVLVALFPDCEPPVALGRHMDRSQVDLGAALKVVFIDLHGRFNRSKRHLKTICVIDRSIQ